MALNKKKKKTDTPEENSPKKKSKKANAKTKTDKKSMGKKNETTELKEQLTAEKDRVLRLSAEFENYKKRKQRELDEFKKFANETLFRQFLSVVDNLERAIESAKDGSDASGLMEGVELTHKDIIKLFETFSVKQVEAQGQPFDPTFHQAVTQEETDKVPENTVTTVLQKGYLLHDRLIRPAMVVVSKKVTTETENTKEN